jgi:hypothetical protein
VNVRARVDWLPIRSGVLMTRIGDVHERGFGPDTVCGRPVLTAVPVSPLQALVHKIPLCGRCYPSVNATRGAGR